MDEILASIRKIISDDEPAAAPAETRPDTHAARTAPAADGPGAAGALDAEDNIDLELSAFDAEMKDAEAASDVLELTETMQSQTPAFEAIEGPPDLEFGEPREAAEPAEPRARPDKARFSAPPERPLMSARTAAAVDKAFHSLAHTVLVQNSRTLEDLVREMLKPMLKAWLDDNLPNMVERLVRAEIERVARGRG